MRFNLYLAWLLLGLLLLCGCGADDDGQPPVPYNSFDINGTNYPTSNGYLIYDDGPPFDNAYGIFLYDSPCRSDTVRGISCDVSGEQGVVLWFESGGGPVPDEPSVNLILGTTPVGEETTALTDVSAYTTTYPFGSVLYGQVDEAGANIYEVGSSGIGTCDFQSITTDFTRREAQVDLTYSFTANGQQITGAFTGRLDMLNGF